LRHPSHRLTRPSTPVHDSRSRWTRLLFVVLSLVGAACWPQTLQAQAVAPPGPSAAHFLPRLLQFEGLLGAELSSETGLCIDAILQSAWLIPGSKAQEVQPLTIDRVRRAAEVCDAETGPYDRRLAEQLRARVAQQLESAEWLQERLPKARACLMTSVDQTTLHACLTAVLGEPPSDADWRRWLALFERAKR
jgi:hypothetical protein